VVRWVVLGEGGGKVAVDRRQLAGKDRRRIHPLGGISGNTSALIYGGAF